MSTDEKQKLNNERIAFYNRLFQAMETLEEIANHPTTTVTQRLNAQSIIYSLRLLENSMLMEEEET